jgi:hypothetical protein
MEKDGYQAAPDGTIAGFVSGVLISDDLENLPCPIFRQPRAANTWPKPEALVAFCREGGFIVAPADSTGRPDDNSLPEFVCPLVGD